MGLWTLIPGVWDTRPGPGKGALPRKPAVPPPTASSQGTEGAPGLRIAANRLPPRDNGAAEGLTSGAPQPASHPSTLAMWIK